MIELGAGQCSRRLSTGRVIASTVRSGCRRRICAAQILADLGDVRARFPTMDQLATEAGVTPVP
jgi:hypothetical protein